MSGRRLVYKFGPSAYSWNAEGGPAAPSGVLVDEDDDDDEAIDEDEGVVEAPPHPPPPPADHVNHVSVIAYGPAFLSHH